MRVTKHNTSFLAHRPVLVLDHLVVGARTGLRQLHIGDELFDAVLPSHVLDGPHPFVDFGRQFLISPSTALPPRSLLHEKQPK